MQVLQHNNFWHQRSKCLNHLSLIQRYKMVPIHKNYQTQKHQPMMIMLIIWWNKGWEMTLWVNNLKKLIQCWRKSRSETWLLLCNLNIFVNMDKTVTLTNASYYTLNGSAKQLVVSDVFKALANRRRCTRRRSLVKSCWQRWSLTLISRMTYGKTNSADSTSRFYC